MGEGTQGTLQGRDTRKFHFKTHCTDTGYYILNHSVQTRILYFKTHCTDTGYYILKHSVQTQDIIF